MLSLSNIKLRRILHGHGKLIQLDGGNWLRRHLFAAFSITFLWTSCVLLSLLGVTTGSFHGTLELKTPQMPGSLLVTSCSWLSVKILVSICLTGCYTANISGSHFTNWSINNIMNSCTQWVSQVRTRILLSLRLVITTHPWLECSFLAQNFISSLLSNGVLSESLKLMTGTAGMNSHGAFSD